MSHADNTDYFRSAPSEDVLAERLAELLRMPFDRSNLRIISEKVMPLSRSLKASRSGLKNTNEIVGFDAEKYLFEGMYGNNENDTKTQNINREYHESMRKQTLEGLRYFEEYYGQLSGLHDNPKDNNHIKGQAVVSIVIRWMRDHSKAPSGRGRTGQSKLFEIVVKAFHLAELTPPTEKSVRTWTTSHGEIFKEELPAM